MRAEARGAAAPFRAASVNPLCRAMPGTCHQGQYWDHLLRKCMSCQTQCAQPYRPEKCNSFCVAIECKSVTGNFYDLLLKRCLRCSEVCGRHPLECSPTCSTKSTTLDLTKELLDRPSVQIAASEGRPSSGVEYHTVLIYCLLGVCLAMLLCTLTLAALVLLRRARVRKQAAVQKAGDTTPQEHDSSSRDRLLGASKPPLKKASLPTETCVHCFPELRVPACRPEKEPPRQIPASTTLYQQASVTGPATRGSPCCLQGGAPSLEKDRLRIICSPTQSSI
ncbi:tumor necrosis factor receptor superfamily member 13B [Brienomyrus brachyistius]|uniref:tumor necrosis factor receptor superfamily member 13B n=1 Tax=Brienomyrus brachyistius TaxID=42636 RepID=UPI0020B25861|nr:tumor necrosis factor receptor superfamily member 13B [Brienomyrus brachyistius]